MATESLTNVNYNIVYRSLSKQQTFGDATPGLPAK